MGGKEGTGGGLGVKAKRGPRVFGPGGPISAFLACLGDEKGDELFDLFVPALRTVDRCLSVFGKALDDGEFVAAGLALVFVGRHGTLLSHTDQ
ncbi:MAG: hypothetical protein JG766_795 [Desulfacinum sp.]|nr:hypothetical protein [Desulfacinum sp.]